MRRHFMLAASVIAVLAVLLLLIRFLPTPREQGQQAYEETKYQSINLLQLDYTAFSTYTLASAQYNYTLVNDGLWKWEQHPEVPLEQSVVVRLLVRSGYFVARECIEEHSDDLAQYGLDQPYATVTITMQDGTSHQLRIGNAVSAEQARYVCIDDETAVYLAAETMCESVICSVNTLRYVAWDPIKPEEVQAFRLERGEEVIAIQRKTNQDVNVYTITGWEMTTPYQRDVNSEIFNTMVIEAMRFCPLDYVEEAPASYAPYGLDHPSYRITVTKTDGHVFDIFLGSEQDGMLYAKLPDASAVFTVSSTGAAFRDYSSIFLLESLVFSRRATAVDHIEFFYRGRNYVLTFRADGTMTRYFAGDREKDEAVFLKTYQALIASIIVGEAMPERVGAELCRYTFYYNTGTPSETVVFYEYGSRYAAVSVNGAIDFVVKQSDVQAMIDAVQALF